MYNLLIFSYQCPVSMSLYTHPSIESSINQVTFIFQTEPWIYCKQPHRIYKFLEGKKKQEVQRKQDLWPTLHYLKIQRSCHKMSDTKQWQTFASVLLNFFSGWFQSVFRTTLTFISKQSLYSAALIKLKINSITYRNESCQCSWKAYFCCLYLSLCPSLC